MKCQPRFHTTAYTFLAGDSYFDRPCWLYAFCSTEDMLAWQNETSKRPMKGDLMVVSPELYEKLSGKPRPRFDEYGNEL